MHIPLDPVTKTPKGLGYVTFADPEKAVAAYEALDKKSFQGRLLHVLAAVDRKGKVIVEDVGKKKSLKEEREAKKKTSAGKDFNWGMLYMNVCTRLYMNIFLSQRLFTERCRGVIDCGPHEHL